MVMRGAGALLMAVQCMRDKSMAESHVDVSQLKMMDMPFQANSKLDDQLNDFMECQAWLYVKLLVYV